MKPPFEKSKCRHGRIGRCHVDDELEQQCRQENVIRGDWLRFAPDDDENGEPYVGFLVPDANGEEEGVCCLALCPFRENRDEDNQG